MERRIAVEENVLQSADVFIESTQHTIDTQYALYDHVKSAKFKVIPPGVNLEIFYPFYRMDMPSFKMSIEQEQAIYRVNSDIERFLFNPAKPLILSIGRADRRKNFEVIIQSYGQDKELQAMANLAIFAGVRKDISQMPEDEQDILKNLLLLLDKYDLYGKIAIHKKNDPKLEVPEIYRIVAKRGIYVNTGEFWIDDCGSCRLRITGDRIAHRWSKRDIGTDRKRVTGRCRKPQSHRRGTQKNYFRSDIMGKIFYERHCRNQPAVFMDILCKQLY
jgi:hypothetical protein